MMAGIKVRTRLALGFGALLALMLLVVAVAFAALRQAGIQASVLARQDLALVSAAFAMQAAQATESALEVRCRIDRVHAVRSTRHTW